MDTLIPARKRAASVALLFCGGDGKTDLSGVGSVGGAGVGNRELGLDKIGGVDRRSCDLKDTKPAAKIKSTASALREVFTKTRMDPWNWRRQDPYLAKTRRKTVSVQRCAQFNGSLGDMRRFYALAEP